MTTINPPPFKSITVPSAPETLVQEIIEMVRTGRLEPGTRLPPQRELARRFGVGMGSVREAIKILTATGYLEVVRGKGTFIAPDALSAGRSGSELETRLKAISLADLMRAREIVECGAVRVAAAESDPEHIERLAAIIEEMDRHRGAAMAFNRADFDFHLALAEASNNGALIEMVRLLVDKAHEHVDFMERFLKTFQPAQVDRAVETARRTLARIRTGDPEGAARCLSQHLNIVNFELEKEFSG